MQFSQIKISKLILIFLLLFIAAAQPGIAQETDILDFLPAILAAAARNTDNNVGVPLNQFNIGDSIGEALVADGTSDITDLEDLEFLRNHQTVWSTGYNPNDTVYSLNERFENRDALNYYENNEARDFIFNHAVSGAVMGDFAVQATDIVAAASSSTPSNTAGMVTILLGNNDVCAPSLEDMTNPEPFENQYRAGLDVLANSPATSSSYIHVSGIPAIYWLWNAKRNNNWCRFAWQYIRTCQNLLASPEDDCVSDESRLAPNTVYEGDGPNCIRRKTFHARIRDIYNPILKEVLQEYIDTNRLPNAYFIDIFDVILNYSHINDADCFHPSEAGHALLSDEEWCRSQWGKDDLTCAP